MADWQTAYLKAGGYPDTPQNRAFLTTWQHFEGGSTNNNAHFNFLNTTWNAPGATSINSVGVKAYKDLGQGASAWAATLKANRNYSGLDASLRAGNPYTKASVPGLSTWLSGSPNSSHGLSYATKVLGTKLAPAPPQATSSAPTPTALSQSPGGPSAMESLRAMTASALLSQSAATVAGQPSFDSSGLMALAIARKQLMSAHDAYGPQPTTGGLTAAPSAPPRGGPFRAGDPVIGGTRIGGEHETMGLAGYPAKDYFAPAGSTAVAPVTGKVVRLSGHDPANGPTDGPHGPLGWSVYIQGSDGHTYYMTHMGSRNVKPGQIVKAGQPIGTVANYDKYGTPSHIHMGVH